MRDGYSAGVRLKDGGRRRGGSDGVFVCEGQLRVVSHSSAKGGSSKSIASKAAGAVVYAVIDKSLTLRVYELDSGESVSWTMEKKQIFVLRLKKKTAALRVSGRPYSSYFTIEIPQETKTTFCAGTASGRAHWLHAMTASRDAKISIRRTIDEWWSRGGGGVFSIFRGGSGGAGVLGEGGQALVSCCTPKRRKWWALISEGRSSYSSQADSGKRYALKRAKGQDCAQNMIRNEVKILLELQRGRHKCIPIVYDAIIEPNHGAALVLEMLTGGELFERVKLLQKFTEKHAREIVVQLVSCIQHLHTRRICHRDIKAENILYVHETSNRIKLIDFGASRILKSSSASPTSLSRSTSSDDLASPTLQFGTFEYLAPEFLEWSVRGYSSDMWSLGCVVHLLLVGSLPFHAMAREDQEHAILHADVDFNTEAWSSVSYAARVFVRDLLTRSPMTRLSADAALDHVWLTNMFHAPNVSRRRASAPANIKIERAVQLPHTDQLDLNLIKNSLPRTPLASLPGSPLRVANAHDCSALSTTTSSPERCTENASPSHSPHHGCEPAGEEACAPGLLLHSVDITRRDSVDVDEPPLVSPRRLRSHQNLREILSYQMKTLNSIKTNDDNKHISNHIKSMSCQNLRYLCVDA